FAENLELHMKRPDASALAIALALALSFPALSGEHGHADGAPPAGERSNATHDTRAADDAHAAHAAATEYPQVRWQPDAPLTQGMQRVRAATHALAHSDHGHLDEAQLRNIADELQSAVDDMFAQ